MSTRKTVSTYRRDRLWVRLLLGQIILLCYVSSLVRKCEEFEMKKYHMYNTRKILYQLR